MASHGWLARVFGTEVAADRPRKGDESKKAVRRVEKRLCGNCASPVGVAAHRCPHCGYRLAQPNAPHGDDRLPDGAVSKRGLDENSAEVSLPHGVTALTGVSGV